MFTRDQIDAFLDKVLRVKTTLTELAEELDIHQRHFTRSSLASSVITCAGVVISIVGGALAIATIGASVVLVPLGTSLGALGGTIGGSAFIADKIVSKQKQDAAQTAWTELQSDPVFQEYFRREEIPEEFRNDEVLSIGQRVKNFFKRRFRKQADSAYEPVAVASTSSTAVAVAGRTAFRSLSAATKALLIGGVVVDGILLPLTIYNIVQDSIDIHKGTGSPAGDTLRNLVTAIEAIEEEVNLRWN